MTKSGGFFGGVLCIYCHRKFYIRVTITWESSELRIGDSGQPNSISIIRFDRKKYFAWEKRAYQGKKSVLKDCPLAIFNSYFPSHALQEVLKNLIFQLATHH